MSLRGAERRGNLTSVLIFVIAGLTCKLIFAFRSEMANQVRHDKGMKRSKITTSLRSSE